MPSCEKCWEDAYLRWMEHPEKDRTDHYKDLLRERTSNPCSPEEQAGQFWDEKNRCDFRLVKMKEG
uniref:Uncharacterized protein n=1 Tax=viral metagenome TaxID=1070528 RepID=A0A6M3LIL9_9ZZZZ